MSNPKFSVVIPAYNVDRYIAECLDSILGQGRNDVEVIVVNDGSTDSTSEVVGGFVHEQASVLLVNQENRGQLAARRAGLAHAHGDYILCVDGDDGLVPGALDILADIIDCHSPDCIMFAFTRTRDALADGHVSSDIVINFPSREEVILRFARTRDLNNMCSKCVRRSCMESERDFGRFGRMQNGEDLVQSIAVIEASRTFVEMDAALYYYRPNASSITSTFRESDIRDVFVARGEVHSFLERERAGVELGRAAFAVDLMQAVDIAQSACLSSASVERRRRLLDRIVDSDFYRLAEESYGGISSLRPDYRPLAPLLTRKRYGAFAAAARVRAAAIFVYRVLRARGLR